MAEKNFFEERSDQSEIKARIVQKYFKAWANVIMPTAKRFGGKIGYVDLYAGPGRYKDGSASTPLLVLEQAVNDANLAKMLVAMLNDKNQDFSASLAREVAGIENIDLLRHKPMILNGEVDESVAKYFEESKLIPTFSFVDPWGYRDLSLKIVNAFIKDWGCDCVFFFNYSRINAVLSNRAVREHMDALFGKARTDSIRTLLPGKTPRLREALILEELAQAIKELGGKYVLPFRFKNKLGKRTSHCLVFVSKHKKGYEIMKEIMAKESSTAEQGVSTFTYCPADRDTPLLFSLTRPLDDLENLILDYFADQRLTMVEIYDQHNVDTPYLKRNYKAALGNLEAAKKIKCQPAERPIRKGVKTFADKVIVQFPRKS